MAEYFVAYFEPKTQFHSWYGCGSEVKLKVERVGVSF